ncbi:MOSC domain-containing protein [uncultured Roseobacter sp.]|uniref:MOSC domain-containing protein n=1 Tax=uncultured Roseobacter sp. TaxID=114847 RepID=UPI002603F739|nr:MOSC domain-containing protein [uncultured Roseobacter sp.]
MPALLPTHFTGTITWLGRVRNSAKTLRAEALETAELTFAGIAGECHGGLTRPSCVRVKAQYPKGTEIRNVRQLSVLSAEELAVIAAEMGLEAIDPIWVGASMVIEGIPDFTHVPPSSRLQMASGASITVDMENRPCVLPGREIEKDAPGFGAAFKPAAKTRRGVTAWVEREGAVAVGDTVTLHIPDQPVWAHLPDART